VKYKKIQYNIKIEKPIFHKKYKTKKRDKKPIRIKKGHRANVDQSLPPSGQGWKLIGIQISL